MARFNWYFDPLSSHQLKKKIKNVDGVGPPLAKLSGSADARHREEEKQNTESENIAKLKRTPRTT